MIPFTCSYYLIDLSIDFSLVNSISYSSLDDERITKSDINITALKICLLLVEHNEI